MAFRKIPRNVGDGAQHRIEHDGARLAGGAEGAGDGAVVVGDEGDRERVERNVIGRIARRRGEDAVEDDAVLVKQPRVVQELGEFFLGFGIVGRAEEAQHHPAAGRDLQAERAFADQRRGEPRYRIAENDGAVASVL